MTVTIDKIGNGFMRRPGRNNSLPPVVTGSHIDTQPTGGKFDGNYGVLAGLEVVRTLNDHGIETEAPIEVAWWTNEEGSRFVPVMMGSGVFAKAFTLEHAYAARDTEGKSVKDELQRIGYIGAEEPGAHPIGCYFETHIEQGPVLEDHDKTIGVVTGVLGIRWYDCTVTGMEGARRPDADGLAQGCAAGRGETDAGGGGLRPSPPAARPRHGGHGAGAPEQPQRHPRARQVQHRPAQCQRCAGGRRWTPTSARWPRASARSRACRSPSSRSAPIRRSPSTPTASTRCSAQQRSSATSNMPAVSGAGHDAVYMARLAPAGMIFIPCKDGISHNEIEDAKPEHISAGCNVLLHAMLERAGVAA